MNKCDIKSPFVLGIIDRVDWAGSYKNKDIEVCINPEHSYCRIEMNVTSALALAREIDAYAKSLVVRGEGMPSLDYITLRIFWFSVPEDGTINTTQGDTTHG